MSDRAANGYVYSTTTLDYIIQLRTRANEFSLILIHQLARPGLRYVLKHAAFPAFYFGRGVGAAIETVLHQT